MSCISLVNNRLMGVTQLASTWVGWPNGENLLRLACKFDLDQSERKSTQVYARPDQTESQRDPSFQLAAPFGQGLREVVTNTCMVNQSEYCVNVLV